MSDRITNGGNFERPEGNNRPGNKLADDKSTERRHTFIIALLTGLIGILGTFIGSKIQADYARSTQETSIREERKREDREHKKEAYGNYLQAAQDMWVTSADFYNCFVKSDTTPGPCDSLAVELRSRQWYLQRILDEEVSVYGSIKAMELAKDLRDEIPVVTSPGWNTFHYAIVPSVYNYSRIYQAKDAFVKMMCRELPAQPRSDC